MNNTVNDYEMEIVEILDDALNNLKPESFRRLLDRIREMLSDYED